MKIMTGTPPCHGRYVIFVPIEKSEYCEPVIGDYQRGGFLWRQNVLGWIGPLPEPVTAAALRAAAPAKVEYDL